MISSKVLVPAASFVVAVLLSFLSPPVSRQLVRAADGTTGPPPPPLCGASFIITKHTAQANSWDITVTDLPSTINTNAGVSATELTVLHLIADVTIFFTDGTSKFFPGTSERIPLKHQRHQVFPPGVHAFPLAPQSVTKKEILAEIVRSETLFWDINLFGEHNFPKLRVKKVVVVLPAQTVTLTTEMSVTCNQSGVEGDVVPRDLQLPIDAAGNGSATR